MLVRERYGHRLPVSDRSVTGKGRSRFLVDDLVGEGGIRRDVLIIGRGNRHRERTRVTVVDIGRPTPSSVDVVFGDRSEGDAADG